MWNLIELIFILLERVFIFYLFSQRLGFLKNKKFAFFVSFVCSAGIIFLKDYMRLDSFIAIPITVLVIFLSSLWAFSGNKSSKLYWSLVVVLLSMISEVVMVSLISFVPSVNIENSLEHGSDRAVMLAIYMVIYAIVLVVAAKVRIKKLENLYYSIQSQIFTVILVMVGIIAANYLTSIMMLASSYGNAELMHSITSLGILLVVMIIGIIIVIAILGILSKRDLDNKLQANRMSYQNSYVKAIESSYKTLRKQRHDMKDQISIMSILLSEKNYAELDEFFRQLDEKYNEIDIVMPTNNSAINACLSVKANEAKQNGIEFHCLANFSGTIPLPDIDSCTLLANLLNNAIEACLLVDKAYPRKIQVDIFEKNSMFGIRVANTYTGTYNMINGEFKTLKKSGDHGIGIPEMREIVEGHNGFIQFDAQEEWFTATAIIPMKGNANA